MESIWNLEQVAAVTGGNLLRCSGDIPLTKVSKDTRKDIRDALYVALPGETFDGHDFVAQATENGAICSMVDHDDEKYANCPVLVVEDTLRALQKLATEYRRYFQIPVVGITGSVGKTSTRGMVSSVLRQCYQTHMTSGNHNNEIGLPMTVFELNREHEISVLEMGMSHFGEISRLTKIAAPDTAIITNIGQSHMENLGSQEGILKAKLEITDGLQSDGTIIMNGDDPLLWDAKDDLEFETLYYGIRNKNCDLCAYDVCTYSDSSEFKCKIDGKEHSFFIKVPGEHHIHNALAAILVGIKYNVNIEDMKKGIREFLTENLRQKIIELSKYRIIRDCYNASPTSMRSAFDVMQLQKCKGRKIACLADMLELGKISEQAHYQVGKQAVEYGADRLYAVGRYAGKMAEGARDAGMDSKDIFTFGSNAELKERLQELIQENDLILVKGSRGMHMEEISNAIEEL